MTTQYVNFKTKKMEYGIQTITKPWRKLRSFLVKPKDKLHKDQKEEVVYEIPCGSCDATYIGETGRTVATRVSEHEKDTERVTAGVQHTRSQRKASLTTLNKSAVTDHASRNNHVIQWSETRVLQTERDDHKRRIREAICIRRAPHTMNRDEGAYQLDHAYDRLIKRRGRPRQQQQQPRLGPTSVTSSRH